MSVKKEFTFKSASGLADISAISYIPEDKENVRFVFQIAHGMAEHKERYDAFAEKLCENGFAVYINDHLGHGKSVSAPSELGYFGEQDGWTNFIKDCRQLTKIAKNEFPSVPIIFFGHSMGSFISRAYTAKYADDLAGAIFCGTAGPNPASKLGASIATSIGKRKGSHYQSTFINNLAFGSYNKRFDGRTDFDWLTRDKSVVDEYIADDLCGFLFTAYGYRDMFNLLTSVSSKDWFLNYPKDLPVLMISGAEDPVGNYSKGVQVVYDKLKEAGKDNVTMHIYPGGRHEILNESVLFEKVCSDIFDWTEELKK